MGNKGKKLTIKYISLMIILNIRWIYYLSTQIIIPYIKQGYFQLAIINIAAIITGTIFYPLDFLVRIVSNKSIIAIPTILLLFIFRKKIKSSLKEIYNYIFSSNTKKVKFIIYIIAGIGLLFLYPDYKEYELQNFIDSVVQGDLVSVYYNFRTCLNLIIVLPISTLISSILVIIMVPFILSCLGSANLSQQSGCRYYYNCRHNRNCSSCRGYYY